MRGKLGKSGESKKSEMNRFEKTLAKKLGGQAVPASGALDKFKGDVRTKDFLMDSKHTEHRSISISALVLAKITREATEEGKNPAIVATLEKVPFGTSPSWVIMPLPVFTELMDEVYQARKQ